MHSFHQSRGRIFFEIFCALTVAASCAIAYLQTGATSMLAIAGVAAAYSLVHATDVRRRAAPTAEAPRAEAPAKAERAVVSAEAAVEELAVAEPKASKPKRRSRKKQPAEEPVVAEAPPVVEVVEIAEHEPEPVASDEPPADLPVVPMSVADAADEPEDDYHPLVTPLFEPQPMVRQLRTFGRKAG